MSYSDKEQWYRQIIMDHYNLPRNKGLVEDDSYIKVHLKNPSCGDDLQLQVKLEDEKIVDIRYEGTGCAICCSSVSMLTDNVKKRSTAEALEIVEAFLQMLMGQREFDEDVIGEAISLQGVAKLPPRIKCATLGYKALQRILTNIMIDDDELEEVK